jgi:hypothetical protein
LLILSIWVPVCAAGGLESAEDTSEDKLWFWELREPKKELQPPAAAGEKGSGGGKGSNSARAAATANCRKMVELYRRRRKDVSGAFWSHIVYRNVVVVWSHYI